MKAKTKLIMSIMSVCLVCAVFAIGVFALRTANLKIGGDVSFSATGVEATINKVAVTADSVADEANHFKEVTIDTTQTQSEINSSENASSWSGLDITIGEAGRVDLDVSVKNNADTTTEKNNYIEVDSNVDLGTGNNVKITISPKIANEHVSDYIIAPGETDYYTISFVVENTELNASLEGFVFQLVLNHTTPVGLEEGETVTNSKMKATDGVVYTLNNDGTASLGNTSGVGDNYTYAGGANLKIAPVVTDGEYNYIVTTIDDYAFYSNDAWEANQQIENVIIPNSVTSIGHHAFLWCNGLASVTIGDGVTSIGDSAFNGCTSLFSVIFGDNITSIGRDAFSSCISLNSIVIPDGVTSIDLKAFDSCENLTSVILGDGVTNISDYMFERCFKLASVIFGKNLISIGDFAFNECEDLTSISIPDSVTSIGDGAFMCCMSLTSIIIPSSVTSIGTDIFNGCRRLTSIVVSSGNSVYDSRNNCNAIIETTTNTLLFGCKNTTIPNSVTSIGYSAFYDHANLTSITIPSSVTSIGKAAFGESGLTSVKFEETTGWWYADSADATSGTDIAKSEFTIDASAANAKLLTETYVEKYLFRTVS